MFPRGAFVLCAVALVGVVLMIYIVIGQTPYFPKALQSTYGECPPRPPFPNDRRVVIDEYEAEWFASALQGLRETPIFELKDSSRRILRLTLVRSFVTPVVVRAEAIEGGRTRLVAKWAEGPAGCPSASETCTVDRILTQAEQGRLFAAQAPMLRTAPYGCLGGVDGSRWIVEVSGHGDYGLWHEWSPESGDLRTLALTLIDLSGFQLSP